jgi:site-specific recombinase XerC
MAHLPEASNHGAHPKTGAAAAPRRRTHTPETRRLYQADWSAFESWCIAAGLTALPAKPATVVAFLTAGVVPLGAGTLARRASAIAAQHRYRGLASPSADPAVKAVLRTARQQAAPRRTPPAAPAWLIRLAAACPGDLAGLRDRALLLLAASGLGRAALVGLDVESIRFTAGGLAFLSAVADNFANGAGEGGHWTTIPCGARENLCPMRALRDWLHASHTTFGPVFRKIDRWGNIEHHRLGTDAVRRILTRRTPRRHRGRRSHKAAA